MTSQEGLKGIDFLREDDESTASNMVPEKVQVIDTSRRDPLTGSLHYSEKLKLMQLLEQWEEPEIRDGNSVSSKKEYSKWSSVLLCSQCSSFNFSE
jgi:hypothetical protein